MVDMNMFAAGYGGNQGQQQPTNPAQGVAASQQARNMPGAIGEIVAAMKSGYEDGMKKRNAALPAGPIFGGAGAPLEGTPDAMGLVSPDAPAAPPIPGAGGIPGPVATMPPASPVPFPDAGGLPGIPQQPPSGGGMGLMDIFGNGMPQGGMMSALLGGPPPTGWGMFG